MIDDALPEMTPEEIGPLHAPLPRDSVASARFGDEVVLVDAKSGHIHVLNSTAALLWECFDGAVNLEQLATELSDEFGVPLEQVRDDTMDMVRELGRKELLSGVSPPPPQNELRLGLLGVGESLAPFHARAGDGREVLVPRGSARGTLLVNWSPFCGYCAKIIDELAESRAALSEHDIDLVLLSIGTPEDNARLLEPLGLTDAVLYRLPTREQTPDAEPGGEGDVAHDPFGPLGTPVAYLLDGEGRVAQPLAYGAGEVPMLARSAVGASPTGEDGETTSAKEPDAETPRPRRAIPTASGVCGSAGGNGKPSRRWAVTSAYAIGDLRIGIRCDSLRTDEVLARALSDYRLAGEVAAPDHFSVVLGVPGAGELSLLLAADTVVVRSRSPRRVVAALQAHLSGLLEEWDDGLLRTRHPPAVARGAAVLLPPSALHFMDRLQPRLARMGIGLSDEPYARLDPGSGELVVPEPRIRVADEVLDEIDQLGVSRSEVPPVSPGRYPVVVAAFDAESAQRSAFVSRAVSVAGTLPAVTGEPELLPAILDGLGKLFESVRAVPIRAGSRAEMTRSVEGLVAAL